METFIPTSPEDSRNLSSTSTPSPNIIITVVLDDSNYPLWSQLMDMRIGARNKSGYLTGATVKPPTTDPHYDTWITENKKVKRWLIESMTLSLMQRFIRLESAREIWDAALRTFYDGSDDTCLFELHQRSFSTKQLDRPLSTYYNDLLTIFQEIDHRMSSPATTVNDVVNTHSSLARMRVYNFLSAVDSEYDHVRGEILRKDPKRTLREHMRSSVVTINSA
ncbi:uncharacterized protein LOC133285667 [Gastrolobium bilobum]|uniref:uncharacterized protein LOC133285667 n=1 Tax=Gastrolobium bilobum TaxID=150636 RepID=UPI002AB2A3B6|nr:uncharacterized protein LOC133285667 [Gastrolobium bilobum]